jgi:hypothetical protein
MDRRLGDLVVGAAIVATLSGCTRASSSPQPVMPTAILLEVPARPDSALRLAQFAIQAIDGSPQPARPKSGYTTVAMHYARTRSGGGQTQVAVIAAVEHTMKNAAGPVTAVELSAWVLDLPRQLTPAQRRAGIPATAITTDAPLNPRVRAATARDTVYWSSLEYVAEVFLRHGARRLP